MWDFLGSVLEEGGFVAVLFSSILISFGVTTRALWNNNQALQRELRDLQEKRVAEAQEVIREFVEHVSSTENSMDKIGTTLEIIRDLMAGRRR